VEAAFAVAAGRGRFVPLDRLAQESLRGFAIQFGGQQKIRRDTCPIDGLHESGTLLRHVDAVKGIFDPCDARVECTIPYLISGRT
jgi:hypothetical protein